MSENTCVPVPLVALSFSVIVMLKSEPDASFLTKTACPGRRKLFALELPGSGVPPGRAIATKPPELSNYGSQ